MVPVNQPLDARRPGQGVAPANGLARRFAGALISLAGLALLALVSSFVLFVHQLERVENEAQPRADGIVALTGGAERIADALALLARGKGDRLLITGVNEKTSRAEIIRHEPELQRLFDCCVDLDYQALNTIGNAEQAARWARQRNLQSLLVVTSTYHMPRTLAELGHVMPDMKLVPYPVIPDRLDLDAWWNDPRVFRLLGVEYLKYLAALVRTRLEPRPAASDVTGLHKP
jgi:uncharacterized SAM-binding protein YcdF (DUF218 family)